MGRFAQFTLAAALAATGLALPAGTASAADMAVAVYDESAEACGQGWVLSSISSRFDWQVTHVPHLPQVQITDFQGIHQRRYLPASEQWPIGRRYCAATVALSDGMQREIWYLIEEGQGFASMGNNVEFCVSGFDRWIVYNGRCRVLR